MKKILCLLLGLAYSSQAFAEFDCSAKVKNILVYRDGTVNILHLGRGDYTHICNLNTERLGVSTTVCAMWVGLLQSVKRKDGLAHFYYSGTGTCATLPVYSASPAPIYVGDVTP